MNIQHLTSEIADTARHMFKSAGDRVEHGKDVLEHKVDQGRHLLEDKVEQGRHLFDDNRDAGASFTSVMEKGATGVRAITGIVGAYGSVRALASVLRATNPGRYVLASLGLQRRPSTFERVALGVGVFAAGAAVGAGVALLLAPRPGTQARTALKEGLQTVKRDVNEVAQNVEEAATSAVEDAEAAVKEIAQEVSGSAQNVTNETEPTATRKRSPGVTHRAPR